MVMDSIQQAGGNMFKAVVFLIKTSLLGTDSDWLCIIAYTNSKSHSM